MNLERESLIDRVSSKIKYLLDTNNSEEIRKLIYQNDPSSSFDVYSFKNTFQKNSNGLDYASIKRYVEQQLQPNGLGRKIE